MKAMKKRMAWLFVFVFLVSAIGCSGGGENSSTAGDTSAVSDSDTGGSSAEESQAEVKEGNSWEWEAAEGITLTYFYDKLVPSAGFDGYWGKDYVSQKIIEDTGVNLEFQFPPDNSHSKLQVLIAGGTLPDMIMSDYHLSIVQQLATNDRIWAIDDLQDEYAPDFLSRNLGDHVILHQRMSWNSMKVYGIPNGYYSQEMLENGDFAKNKQGVAVIEQIYQELGSPDTTTTDGFLDLLRQVKGQYPDMIPAQASRNNGKDADGNLRLIYKLFPMFDLGSRYDVIDGKYVKYWYSPKFLDLLKFVNTLYNEGLVDPTEFTDSGEQLQAKEFSGMVFADMNQDANNIDWFNRELQKLHPDWNFVMIEAPSAYEDMSYGADSIGGGIGNETVTMITKSSEYPGRCLQLMDYLLQDDTQIILSFGIEGKSWDSNEDGIPTLYPEFNDMEDDEKKGTYGVGAYWLFGTNDIDAMTEKNGVTDAQIRSLDITAKYYKDLSFYSGAESYTADSEEIKIFTNVKEYYEVKIMELITCAPDQLEGLYEEMISTIDGMGQETLNEQIDAFFQNKDATMQQYSVGLASFE